MSDNDDKKKKLEVSLDIGYVNEQDISNGELESAEGCGDSLHIHNGSIAFKIGEEIVDLDISLETCPEIANPDFSLEKMKQDFDNNVSSKEIYDKLCKNIIENKNNPSYIRNALISLEGTLENLYDHDESHANANTGNNNYEALEKILNISANSRLNGFVCIQIHEFGMRLLHDCGINAVVLYGAAGPTNHATLLYKQEDGKYVHINYGSAYTINANNIKDAVREIYKNDCGLHSCGYIGMIDDNCSYQEYALKEEAIWGDELDKRDYYNKNLFDNEIGTQNSLGASVQYSNMGNVTAEICGNYVNKNGTQETAISIGYKESGKTSLYDNSQSLGLKIEHNAKNQKDNPTFFQSKLILNNTKGNAHINYNVNPFTVRINDNIDEVIAGLNDNYFDVNNELNDFIQELKNMRTDLYNQVDEMRTRNKTYSANNISLFTRVAIGKENNLLNTPETNLKNTAQVSLIGSLNKVDNNCIGGDVQLSLEDGMQVQNKIGNTLLTNNVSGGILSNLQITGGDCKPGAQFGLKFNLSSSAQTQINNNIAFGCKIGGHSVISKPAVDCGLNGNIYGIYNTDKAAIFSSASISRDLQKLKIGGFNEQTENSTTFGAKIGVQNKNGSLSLNYTNKLDKLNSTRNRSVVSLNATVNL